VVVVVDVVVGNVSVIALMEIKNVED
jgi:hypothetical protein